MGRHGGGERHQAPLVSLPDEAHSGGSASTSARCKGGGELSLADPQPDFTRVVERVNNTACDAALV